MRESAGNLVIPLRFTEVTILDSKYAARQLNLRDAVAPVAPGERLSFRATAYCKGLVTTSGVAAQSGVGRQRNRKG